MTLLNAVLKRLGIAYEHFRRVLKSNPLRTWYYFSLKELFSEAKNMGSCPNLNYYEFGVGWGRTLTSYIQALKAFTHNKNLDFYDYHIFGFDSFEGLPETTDTRDKHLQWPKGAFSHGVAEIEHIVSKIGVDLKKGNLQFIKDFSIIH